MIHIRLRRFLYLTLVGITAGFTVAPPASIAAREWQDTELHSRLVLGKQVTVVIVFARDCAPCVEALPFYKKLAALPQMDGIAGRLTFLTTTAPLPALRWFNAGGLKPHKILGYPRTATIEIPEDAPSVTLLDPNGKRLNYWKGAFSDDVQKAVLEALGRVR